MKRFGTTILILAAVLLAIGGLLVARESNPLRRSDEGIKKWVLQKTPLGSSRSDVIAVSGHEGWGGPNVYVGTDEVPEVGVTHFGADLGSYRGFLTPCHVHAYWSFDGQDKLMNVYIVSWCEGM